MILFKLMRSMNYSNNRSFIFICWGIFIFSFVKSGTLWADTSEILINLATERKKVINKIKKIDETNYPFEISEIYKSIDKIKEKQVKVCTGEFLAKASIDDEESLQKLTKEDTLICKRDLRNWEINVTRYLFRLRRSFLDAQIKKANKKLVSLEEIEVNRIQTQRN